MLLALRGLNYDLWLETAGSAIVIARELSLSDTNSEVNAN
jgi:hypothetical protein